MEQAVWLYVGIIAALIGLGFVASVVLSGRETGRVQAVENTVAKLQQNCNLVCASDIGTMFSVDAAMVSGMRLYSEARAICADYSGKTSCRQCDCNAIAVGGGAFSLDLGDAGQLFDTRDYGCFMERAETGVAIDCRG